MDEIDEILQKKDFNDDLLDYDKCRALREKLLDYKKRLESQLDSTNNESKFVKVLNHADEISAEIEEKLNEADELIEEAEKYLRETDKIRCEIKEKVDKVNDLQCLLQYMKVLEEIQNLSSSLQKQKNNRDDEMCATVFANLCEISRNLIDVPLVHLRSYLKGILHYWHNILKEKFSKDFDDVLKALKWPFVNTNFSLQIPSQGNIQKLQIITEYLLQIELPVETSTPLVTSALLSDFPPLSLPLQFLIRPLRKRFLFHFYGSRQTNRIDKPEWYFTQILSWIRDHKDFVEKWIQPIVDRMGLHHIDVKLELMRGLVQLAVEKLYSDLPTLQYDDFIFSHSVDEALGFDKELKDVYHYPPTQPSVLAVLTQAQIFVKWLAMEKKFAMEKMDVMLSNSDDAFQPLDAESDDVKITACAETFITLLQTITERYESLPQPGHRLQFLDLQLELLDDFRVRLLQLSNVESDEMIESKIPMIANTLYYVENVLIDWGSMLHYLNLFYYKNQLDSADMKGSFSITDSDYNTDTDLETESVFVDILSLYRHMRKDLLCTLAESVILEIKVRSKEYRRERWSAMTAQKDFRTLSLTPSACPMFEVIAKRLLQLQKSLSGRLFTIVWRYIAQQLDAYLFEDLIMENRFSEGGALQFKYDIVRNLFPLFSQFSDKPENYFIQVMESINLLNISKGSALLLRETLLALEGATGVEDTRGRALKEIGVDSFTPKMAVSILNRRTDITINRIVID